MEAGLMYLIIALMVVVVGIVGCAALYMYVIKPHVKARRDRDKAAKELPSDPHLDAIYDHHQSQKFDNPMHSRGAGQGHEEKYGDSPMHRKDLELGNHYGGNNHDRYGGMGYGSHYDHAQQESDEDSYEEEGEESREQYSHASHRVKLQDHQHALVLRDRDHKEHVHEEFGFYDNHDGGAGHADDDPYAVQHHDDDNDHNGHDDYYDGGRMQVEALTYDDFYGTDETDDKATREVRKYKTSSNSPYFDKTDERNLRKDAKMALSTHGSKLAPVSLWATRMAPKLYMKLANFSDKLLQSFMVSLPCESNFYFEVTVLSEQTHTSFLQVGVADMRAHVEHSDAVDFVDNVGHTTCLGIGRTPGTYSFDFISTQALSHLDNDGKVTVGAGGISASKIKTSKFGNGLRLPNAETYNAIDAGVHHRYGKNDLHVIAGDVVGVYVDYIERKIYISHNGHFTGHFIPMSKEPLHKLAEDYMEHEYEKHGGSGDPHKHFLNMNYHLDADDPDSEAFVPVITALEGQEFFVNIGQEPFMTDDPERSLTIPGQKSLKPHKKSVTELYRSRYGKMHRNGTEDEEIDEIMDKELSSSDEDEVNDASMGLAHEALLMRCMSFEPDPYFTEPFVSTWDDENYEWHSIARKDYPHLFGGPGASSKSAKSPNNELRKARHLELQEKHEAEAEKKKKAEVMSHHDHEEVVVAEPLNRRSTRIRVAKAESNQLRHYGDEEGSYGDDNGEYSDEYDDHYDNGDYDSGDYSGDDYSRRSGGTRSRGGRSRGTAGSKRANRWDFDGEHYDDDDASKLSDEDEDQDDDARSAAPMLVNHNLLENGIIGQQTHTKRVNAAHGLPDGVARRTSNIFDAHVKDGIAHANKKWGDPLKPYGDEDREYLDDESYGDEDDGEEIDNHGGPKHRFNIEADTNQRGQITLLDKTTEQEDDEDDDYDKQYAMAGSDSSLKKWSMKSRTQVERRKTLSGLASVREAMTDEADLAEIAKMKGRRMSSTSMMRLDISDTKMFAGGSERENYSKGASTAATAGGRRASVGTALVVLHEDKENLATDDGLVRGTSVRRFRNHAAQQAKHELSLMIADKQKLKLQEPVYFCCNMTMYGDSMEESGPQHRIYFRISAPTNKKSGLQFRFIHREKHEQGAPPSHGRKEDFPPLLLTRTYRWGYNPANGNFLIDLGPHEFRDKEDERYVSLETKKGALICNIITSILYTMRKAGEKIDYRSEADAEVAPGGGKRGGKDKEPAYFSCHMGFMDDEKKSCGTEFPTYLGICPKTPKIREPFFVFLQRGEDEEDVHPSVNGRKHAFPLLKASMANSWEYNPNSEVFIFDLGPDYQGDEYERYIRLECSEGHLISDEIDSVIRGDTEPESDEDQDGGDGRKHVSKAIVYGLDEEDVDPVTGRVMVDMLDFYEVYRYSTEETSKSIRRNILLRFLVGRLDEFIPVVNYNSPGKGGNTPAGGMKQLKFDPKNAEKRRRSFKQSSFEEYLLNKPPAAQPSPPSAHNGGGIDSDKLETVSELSDGEFLTYPVINHHNHDGFGDNTDGMEYPASGDESSGGIMPLNEGALAQAAKSQKAMELAMITRNNEALEYQHQLKLQQETAVKLAEAKQRLEDAKKNAPWNMEEDYSGHGGGAHQRHHSSVGHTVSAREDDDISIDSALISDSEDEDEDEHQQQQQSVTNNRHPNQNWPSQPQYNINEHGGGNVSAPLPNVPPSPSILRRGSVTSSYGDSVSQGYDMQQQQQQQHEPGASIAPPMVAAESPRSAAARRRSTVNWGQDHIQTFETPMPADEWHEGDDEDDLDLSAPAPPRTMLPVPSPALRKSSIMGVTDQPQAPLSTTHAHKYDEEQEQEQEGGGAGQPFLQAGSLPLPHGATRRGSTGAAVPTPPASASAAASNAMKLDKLMKPPPPPASMLHTAQAAQAVQEEEEAAMLAAQQQQQQQQQEEVAQFNQAFNAEMRAKETLAKELEAERDALEKERREFAELREQQQLEFAEEMKQEMLERREKFEKEKEKMKRHNARLAEELAEMVNEEEAIMNEANHDHFKDVDDQTRRKIMNKMKNLKRAKENELEDQRTDMEQYVAGFEKKMEKKRRKDQKKAEQQAQEFQDAYDALKDHSKKKKKELKDLKSELSDHIEAHKEQTKLLTDAHQEQTEALITAHNLKTRDMRLGLNDQKEKRRDEKMKMKGMLDKVIEEVEDEKVSLQKAMSAKEKEHALAMVEKEKQLLEQERRTSEAVRSTRAEMEAERRREIDEMRSKENERFQTRMASYKEMDEVHRLKEQQVRMREQQEIAEKLRDEAEEIRQRLVKEKNEEVSLLQGQLAAIMDSNSTEVLELEKKALLERAEEEKARLLAEHEAVRDREANEREAEKAAFDAQQEQMKEEVKRLKEEMDQMAMASKDEIENIRLEKEKLSRQQSENEKALAEAELQLRAQITEGAEEQRRALVEAKDREISLLREQMAEKTQETETQKELLALEKQRLTMIHEQELQRKVEAVRMEAEKTRFDSEAQVRELVREKEALERYKQEQSNVDRSIEQEQEVQRRVFEERWALEEQQERVRQQADARQEELMRQLEEAQVELAHARSTGGGVPGMALPPGVIMPESGSSTAPKEEGDGGAFSKMWGSLKSSMEEMLENDYGDDYDPNGGNGDDGANQQQQQQRPPNSPASLPSPKPAIRRKPAEVGAKPPVRILLYYCSSFLPLFCDVSVSLLPIYYCLSAFSDTTRRLTIPPLPQSIVNRPQYSLTYYLTGTRVPEYQV
jgi:hypothetical protein